MDDEMMEIMMQYLYDWTKDEGLRPLLKTYNAKFKCRETDKKIMCYTVVPNNGIREIKVVGPEVVAVGDGEVLLGKRAIIPLEGGKLKIITKLYKKKAIPSHSSRSGGSSAAENK